MRFIAGLDLGQAQDYAAFVVLQIIDGDLGKKHQIRYIERFPLGTHYCLTRYERLMFFCLRFA